MKISYPKKFCSSRNKLILQYCEWKKVLHVWCCDSPYTKDKYDNKWGPLLYREIDGVCSDQLWIDLDKESVEFLNTKKTEFKNSRVQYIDMNQLENLNYIPDVIIFWEVIEHLMNLEVALTNLKKVMSADTLLLISTPNCFSFPNFINTLFGFEQMHEDHKVFFSYWYLKNLLLFNGLVEHDFYFTKIDLEIELNIFGKIVKALETLMIYISKGFCDTLLLIAKKDNTWSQ